MDNYNSIIAIILFIGSLVTNSVLFFFFGGGGGGGGLQKKVIQPLSWVAQQVAVQDQRIHEALCTVGNRSNVDGLHLVHYKHDCIDTRLHCRV